MNNEIRDLDIAEIEAVRGGYCDGPVNHDPYDDDLSPCNGIDPFGEP